jgi:hypothetical protein
LSLQVSCLLDAGRFFVPLTLSVQGQHALRTRKLLEPLEVCQHQPTVRHRWLETAAAGGGASLTQRRRRSYHECDACHYRYNIRRTALAVACCNYKVRSTAATKRLGRTYGREAGTEACRRDVGETERGAGAGGDDGAGVPGAGRRGGGGVAVDGGGAAALRPLRVGPAVAPRVPGTGEGGRRGKGGFFFFSLSLSTYCRPHYTASLSLSRSLARSLCSLFCALALALTLSKPMPVRIPQPAHRQHCASSIFPLPVFSLSFFLPTLSPSRSLCLSI